MKMAIVNSSHPNFMSCWSAKRFTGSCHTCPRVMGCKLQEAVPGRIEVRKENIKVAQEEVKLAQAKLIRREQELIEEQNKA